MKLWVKVVSFKIVLDIFWLLPICTSTTKLTTEYSLHMNFAASYHNLLQTELTFNNMIYIMID